MDELVGRRVAKFGVERTAAAKAVGIVLQFSHKHTEQAHAFIARMSRADGVAHTAQTDSKSAGMVAIVGAMTGTGSRKTAAGSSTIPAAACGTLRHARELAGRDAVGDIVGAIPSRVQ